jgi:hypothetical protein
VEDMFKTDAHEPLEIFSTKYAKELWENKPAFEQDQ